MRRSLKILILFFLLAICKNFAQEKNAVSVVDSDHTEILLDSIISLAKSNSYYSSKVNWTDLEKEMIEISHKNDSIDKIGKPAELMFKTLVDYHGMLMYDYKVAFNYRSENNGPPNDSIYKSIGSTKINSPYSVNGELIEQNKIAYIEILATGVMQVEQINLARDEIRHTICELKQQNPIGWIIDLRCNIGGNMNPMLSGLGELILNADLGGDTKDGKSFHSTWSFKNGNFYQNDYSHYMADLICENPTSNGRIAVLTSKYTASSGEVIVSSLKGQPNLKIIGEKTSGLSSTNGWFVLSDKWVFAPMTAYYMSKDKTVHKNGIIPDVVIDEILDLDRLLQGKIIDRAVKWIELGE